MNDIKDQWQEDRTFLPQITAEEVNSRVKSWHRAVNAAKAWADDSN